MSACTRVSIVVPLYNGERTVAATIESLLAQKYTKFEVILVDDGSTDNTKCIAKGYLTDARVKYIAQANGGVASARNTGIREATGDIIAFCDQDDQWSPEKLSRQIPLFEDQHVGLVYSHARVDNAGSITVTSHSTSGQCFWSLLEGNFIICCTVAVRKALLEEVGLFDEDRRLSGVDDWCTWLKVAYVSEVAVAKEPLATYYLHGDNYSFNELKMHEAELTALEKIRDWIRPTAEDETRFKAAITRTHVHYARNLLHQRSYRDAGNCLVLAWKNDPLQITRLLKGILLKVVPVALLNAIKNKKKPAMQRDNTHA